MISDYFVLQAHYWSSVSFSIIRTADRNNNELTYNNETNDIEMYSTSGYATCGYYLSAVGQLTRPTQPFILMGSIN